PKITAVFFAQLVESQVGVSKTLDVGPVVDAQCRLAVHAKPWKSCGSRSFWRSWGLGPSVFVLDEVKFGSRYRLSGVRGGVFHSARRIAFEKKAGAEDKCWALL